MKTQGTESPKLPEESGHRCGSDAVLEGMKLDGVPLTRAVWLLRNYPDGVPDPLPAELAAEIPPELL